MRIIDVLIVALNSGIVGIDIAQNNVGLVTVMVFAFALWSAYDLVKEKADV